MQLFTETERDDFERTQKPNPKQVTRDKLLLLFKISWEGNETDNKGIKQSADYFSVTVKRGKIFPALATGAVNDS